jgi:pimeloyl-ACP methyl ester carboxylesterase
LPTVDFNGLKLNYADTGGDGTPVLLLHAFPFNSNMWEPQLESLKDRFRLITVDLQGFGGSDAPEDESTYSMDAFADQAAAVLAAAGVDKAAVVGLSMGGYITFALLKRHRDRIAALLLADTRAEADPPEGVEKRTNQQGMVRDEGTSNLIGALAGALLSEPTREKKPDVVEKVKDLMAENPPAGFIGALEAMKNRPDSSDLLSGIDVPTLVIVGENDGITPPDAARKIHEHIGGSRLVVIPEAGHLSNLEAPEAFNGAVAEFLSAL